MIIITLGIDLAKNVFAVHGVDEFGKVALVRPSARRDQLHELIATPPPCVIGMEAEPATNSPCGLFVAGEGAELREAAPCKGVRVRITGPAADRNAATRPFVVSQS